MVSELYISPALRERATKAERERCKASFFEFVVSFWDIVIKEPPIFNWHIPYLCEELQYITPYIVGRLPKPYDLIVNIPPGTTKSTILTIMYPAWLWTQDPTLRIITSSYSMDLSIEHAVKSRDIITSAKYRRLFPEVKLRRDKAAKSMYENTLTGSRTATSTGGTITGKHAHVILSDDPLNPAQAASEPERKAANDHTKTLSSRKVDKLNTISILLMQRLNEEDPTGTIIKKKGDKIKHICLPAELSPLVKPIELMERYVQGLLDPVRLSREVLEEAKTDLGSLGYAGQFMQSPMADGGNLVKTDWFRYINRDTFERMRRNEPIVFFGDTAYTEDSDKNDPSAFIATCKIGNDLYIAKGIKVWLEFPELLKFVEPWVRSNGYSSMSTVRIEPKASGKSIVQSLKRGTTINITQTETPKDSKTVRLTAESPKIEAGRVYLVSDTWNEEFVDEVCGFPNKAHDEYVDLIAYALNYHLRDSKTGNKALKGIASMLP